MREFSSLAHELLQNEKVAREYYRKAPFYDLASQLILLRKERGLTQTELAQKAGTTQAVVSRLENVSVQCSLETVVRLADALDAVVDVKLVTREQLEKRQMQEDAVNNQENCQDMEAEPVVYIDPPTKNCPQVTWMMPKAGEFNLSPKAPIGPVTKKKQPHFA
jgi:transcriptional regulator with XRE-family HTH domain